VRSRTAVWINMIFATIVELAVFAQAYFIAAWATDSDETPLDLHAFTGTWIVHPSEFVVFISALFAFWGAWRWVGAGALLLVLGTVQILLAPPDEDPASGWIHGLHGLLAIVVLVVAAVIQHHDMRLLRQRALPPAP
jgi:hypothetical protein